MTKPITADEIANWIQNFLENSPLNDLEDRQHHPAWTDFLMGISSGADPVWQQYKEYIGPFHWTPWEVFNQHKSQKNVAAENISVISWVLPQTKWVRKANLSSDLYASEHWARARILGEKFNMALRKHLVDILEDLGYGAIAPMLVPNWAIVKSERFSYASSWSERHAAHAAGLGTFGLCDGLITARGKAMRTGSIVVAAAIDPTPRPYSDHRAYCSFFADGTCGKCIERCPADAISKEGHDKEKCRQHLIASARHVKKTFHFEGYGCGLCQVGVPCETIIPVKSARQALEKGEIPQPPPPLA